MAIERKNIQVVHAAVRDLMMAAANLRTAGLAREAEEVTAIVRRVQAKQREVA